MPILVPTADACLYQRSSRYKFDSLFWRSEFFSWSRDLCIWIPWCVTSQLLLFSTWLCAQIELNSAVAVCCGWRKKTNMLQGQKTFSPNVYLILNPTKLVWEGTLVEISSNETILWSNSNLKIWPDNKIGISLSFVTGWKGGRTMCRIWFSMGKFSWGHLSDALGEDSWRKAKRWKKSDDEG